MTRLDGLSGRSDAAYAGFPEHHHSSELNGGVYHHHESEAGVANNTTLDIAVSTVPIMAASTRHSACANDERRESLTKGCSTISGIRPFQYDTPAFALAHHC